VLDTRRPNKKGEQRKQKKRRRKREESTNVTQETAVAERGELRKRKRT